MSDTFHAAAPDELDGLALARLISRLGVELRDPCTFLWDEQDSLASAWELWLEDWFVPVLAPAFTSIHRLANQIRPKEIAVLDQGIDTSLNETLRQRSLTVASAFLTGKSEMRGNREWTRFAERITSGKTPGHAATLFALQTALYHLPLAPALSAYAWFEIECGLPRTGYRERIGSANEVLKIFTAAIPYVRVAMEGDRGESANDVPQLRAI